MGHEVIRLPPHYCQFNTIDYTLAPQVKNQIAKKKINIQNSRCRSIKWLTHEALDSVTRHDLEKCV